MSNTLPTSTQTLAMTAGSFITFPLVSGPAVFSGNSPNGVARVQISGTFNGSAMFMESIDGLTYFPSPFAFADLAPTAGVPIISSGLATYTVKAPGCVSLQIVCTTSGSGSLTATVAVVDGGSIGLNPFASAATFSGGLTFPVSANVNPHNVAAALTSGLIIASNALRKAVSVTNDTATGNLFLGLGYNPSLTAWDQKLAPGALYTPPLNYTGPIYGIWDVVDGNGLAHAPEYV